MLSTANAFGFGRHNGRRCCRPTAAHRLTVTHTSAVRTCRPDFATAAALLLLIAFLRYRNRLHANNATFFIFSLNLSRQINQCARDARNAA